jgi:hypothetical protein
MDSSKEIPIEIRRVLPAGSTPPKPANNFAWTRIDNTYHLETSYFDAISYGQLLKELSENGFDDEKVDDIPCLDTFVTDRFVLTPKDVFELFNAVKIMFEDATDSGLIQPIPTND